MKIEFNGRVSSPALEELARKKLERLEKYHKGAEPVYSVYFSVEKDKHIVRIETNYNGFDLNARESSDDMYKSLDMCIDSIKRQISKNKYDKKTRRTNDKGLEY